MFDLAIFTALGWERRAVTAGLAGLESAGPQRWTAQLGGGAGTCVIAQTGLGRERARAAARAMPPARVFVSCGCAGALVDWLRPGDLVAATTIVPVDQAGGASEPLPADPSVAGWAAARGFRVHTGPVVSSEKVLESAGAKADAGASGALVVEMESAAVAAEARARRMVFVGLRVVLDVQGQAVPALDVLDEASGEIRGGRAAVAIVLRPWLWPAVARLGRQTRVAERSLRAIMTAVLGDSVLTAVPAPVAVSAAVS